ncbi:hypothetical protein AB1K70_11885 [Bremerella sp. JC770]|uniref:hypothetical protein n=1 Tax=Bremerella sp. JC770 TaxID=3232137 RepID=UPI0034576CAB
MLVESLEATGQWNSVHAAEYLISVGRSDLVVEAFRAQENVETPQYRIGVWRVLAQAEPSQLKRSEYVERIREVLLDEVAPDRLHALESLAKLRVQIESMAEQAIVEGFAKQASQGEFAFANWRLIQQQKSLPRLTRLAQGLLSEDEIQRLRVAFVLSQCAPLPDPIQVKITKCFQEEAAESLAYPYVAIAVGHEEARLLARSKNPTHVALAIKFLAQHDADFDYDSSPLSSEQSPLTLRQAIAFAILAHTPSP